MPFSANNLQKHRRFFLWTAVGIVLFVIQLTAERSYSKADDPDQARQRPGFVMPQTEKAPVLAGISYQMRPTVIIFDRMAMGTSLFHDLADQANISARSNLVLVQKIPMPLAIATGIKENLIDAQGNLARSFHIDAPRDGGYPIGYVIVDKQGNIRYRTLDPEYMLHGADIRVLLKDVE